MSIIRTSTVGILALAGSITTAAALFEGGSAHNDSPGYGHQLSAQRASARLVQLVREATEPFLDIDAARKAEYVGLPGCVSGPERGAMGVHYVKGSLLDTKLDPSQPEALMYEVSNGRARLVGVEFIVDAASWFADPAHDSPPVLEGQAFQFVDAPNRFNLPAFFELHVWAWRDNPDGAFVDWRTRVTCEGE
jgi:hypothetical protein